MKRLSLPALALLLALPGSALAYTWTGAANDGILNTPENWNPVLPDTFPRWSSLGIALPANGAATAFTLTNTLAPTYITISGGSAEGQPAVFNLGGNILRTLNDSQQLNFRATTPLVFRNGLLISGTATYFGISGNSASPVSLTLDGAALSGGWGTYYTTNLFVLVKDGALTNALTSLPSYSRVVLDNSNVYASSRGEPSPGGSDASTSNLTFRAVNGTTFVTGHTNRRFNINGFDNRYALESGTQMGIPTIMAGQNNRLGVTNAIVATYMTIQGTNNIVSFASAVMCTPGAKSRNFGIAGLGNRLIFEGSAITNDTTSISQGIASTISGKTNLVAIVGTPASYFNGAITFTGTAIGNALSITDTHVIAKPTTISGHDNRLALTNAVLTAAMTISGTNNAVTFKSSVFHDPGFKSRNFGISGLGNRLVFEDSAVTNDETSISQSIENTVGGRSNTVAVAGSSAAIYLGAVSISGTANAFSIADNVVLSNAVKTSLAMYGYPMRPLFKAGSVNCSFLVGTNAVAQFWSWGGMPRGATNMLFQIGRGSSVRTVKLTTDKGSTWLGGSGDLGGRIILDNASFALLEGQYPTIVTNGVSIILIGDSASFTVSSSNGANGNYGVLRICPVADGLEPPHLVFRPGPTGFGGTAPFSTTVRSQGNNILAPTTVFEVDATDFARGKPTGIYEIPLVKKGKSWKQCNLDALNAVGVFTPANGELVANADNDIVFRFKRDCGTRLMVR